MCAQIGLFRNDEDTAAASGHFVHVYVDRATRKTVEMPAEVRQVLDANRTVVSGQLSDKG